MSKQLQQSDRNDDGTKAGSKAPARKLRSANVPEGKNQVSLGPTIPSQTMISARVLRYEDNIGANKTDAGKEGKTTTAEAKDKVKDDAYEQTFYRLPTSSLALDNLPSSGGLMKSSSVAIFPTTHGSHGSSTPNYNQRKISFLQSMRSTGSSASTDASNLLRVRNSVLGKSAPSLSASLVRIHIIHIPEVILRIFYVQEQ